MNGSEKHYLERLLDPEDRDMIEKEEHFSQVMMMYSCAIREVQTKLEVLNDDLKSRYQRNPIHSIKSRIKKPVSLAKKLRIHSSVTSYTFRHSWATTAKYRGVPIEMISESLGHKSIKTTQIYLKGFELNERTKVNRLNYSYVRNYRGIL